MVFFQETKQSDISAQFAKSLWPGDDMDFMVVDSDGAAGGLLCIWKTNVFKLTQCCCTRNCILFSGTFSPDFDCVFVNIYAPNDVSKRGKFWEVMLKLRADFNNPWCLAGDFNEIRHLGERRGCSRRDKGMMDFNQFIETMELTDPPMMGRQFTWCNSNDGERWSRIDRVLMASEWVERFKLKLWGLERTISDHCPLLLMEDGRDWGPRPFRFINAWSLHPQFRKLVKKAWEDSSISGWAGYVIMRKLKDLRLALKKWNCSLPMELVLNPAW
ncbi:uncharacterized protein LOC114300853 [Camellia sinensis]|uniref:uncharacterized protein LOC114300853 n=1 Tax=Camellia sinensis TaxID=4442 RepID=UPI0010355C6C|nr:uncharacterized protein LOC114300853 [Camellia sinensis]